MRSFYSLMILLLAVSCNVRSLVTTDTATVDEPGDLSQSNYWFSYSGWTNDCNPNLFVSLVFNKDNSCLVEIGRIAYPALELDRVCLFYEITDQGVILFEDGAVSPMFVVTAVELDSSSDPGTHLMEYLGPILEIKWETSTGEIWDQYAIQANWPTQLVIYMDVNDFDDIIE